MRRMDGRTARDARGSGPGWIAGLRQMDPSYVLFWVVFLPVAVLAGISVWGTVTEMLVLALYTWWTGGGIVIAGTGFSLVLKLIGRDSPAVGVFAAMLVGSLLLFGTCVANLIVYNVNDGPTNISPR